MTKDDFLNNITISLQKTHLPDARPQKPPSPALPAFEPQSLIAPFTQEALALRCEVHQAASAPEAVQHLADIFLQYHSTEFIAWNDEYFPLPDLRNSLKAQGLTCRPLAIPRSDAERQMAMKSLADVSIGLTGALAGLADTGALALQSGAGRSRLASLLPPVHIAILGVRQLLPTMAHFFHAYPDAARRASNLAFISGPSRTADIEQVLTLGVHGPKDLHIILVNN